MKFKEFPDLKEGRIILDNLDCKSTTMAIADLDVTIDSKNQFKVDTDDGHRALAPGVVTEFSKMTGLNKKAFKDYIENHPLCDSMIKHSLNKRERNVRLVYDKAEILHIDDPTSGWVDPLFIYDDVASIVDPDSRVHSITKDRKGSIVMRFLKNVSKEPPKKVGDYSYCGIWLSSNGSVSISPFIYTLSCTNGLQTAWMNPRRSKINWRAGIKTAIKEQVQRADKVLDEFIELDSHKVSNPEKVIMKLAKELGIPARQITAILGEVSNLQNITQYDLVNAVTRISNDTGDMAFQRLGGKILTALHDSRCDHCGART